MDNAVTTLVPSVLIGSSFFKKGSKDNHKGLDEFGLQAELTSDCVVNCP